MAIDGLSGVITMDGRTSRAIRASGTVAEAVPFVSVNVMTASDAFAEIVTQQLHGAKNVAKACVLSAKRRVGLATVAMLSVAAFALQTTPAAAANGGIAADVLVGPVPLAAERDFAAIATKTLTLMR